MSLLGLIQVALPHAAFLPNVRYWRLFRALFTSLSSGWGRAVTDNVLFILWKFWPFEMKQDWMGFVWQHVGKEGVWITKLRKWAVQTMSMLEWWRAGVWQKVAETELGFAVKTSKRIDMRKDFWTIRTNMVISSFGKKPKLKTLERRQVRVKATWVLEVTGKREGSKQKTSQGWKRTFWICFGVLVVAVGFKGWRCRWLSGVG